MADYGYDVADYCDVDPLFGTLEDLDRLVGVVPRARHPRRARLGPEPHVGPPPVVRGVALLARGPEARLVRVARRRAGGGPPNDWVSTFDAVGPAWTFDERTGQWYLHSFMAEQPDLNWDNPEVEAAMHDVLRFWLDRGIDGFRLDAIVKIAKDPLLRSNGAGALRHHENWGSIHDRLRGIRRVVDEYPDRMIVGEVDAWDLHGLVSFLNGRRPAAPGAQPPVHRAAVEPGGVRGVDRGLRGARRADGMAGVVLLQPRHVAGGEPLRRGRPGRRPGARAAARCSTRCAARRSSTRARSWGCPTR